MWTFLLFFGLIHLIAGNPGQILHGEDLGVVHQGVPIHLYRLTYLTTVKDQLLPARTLVMSPEALPSPHLIFYAHQTLGVSCDCALSMNGTNLDKIHAVPYASVWISAGITIVVPDFYGFICPQIHPYLVGAPLAHSILDAVRAARFWRPNTYGSQISGYAWSLGAFGVLWTQYLAPSYAPELQILIAGAISPPTNLIELLHANLYPSSAPSSLWQKIVALFNGQGKDLIEKLNLPGRWLSLLGMYSWPSYYEGLHMSQLVTPSKLRIVSQLANVCVLLPHPEKNPRLAPLLTLGKNQWLHTNPCEQTEWAPLLKENSVPPVVMEPTQVSIFQGREDELIQWNVTQKWVQSVQGSIEFFLYADQNHKSVIQVAMPVIVDQVLGAFGLLTQINQGF